ncbi:hypothetical protein DIPPA_70158 [Diplonema papillatum]|nr:hypothetical protein DIPPA_70158 [Diplonema papillatum]
MVSVLCMLAVQTVANVECPNGWRRNGIASVCWSVEMTPGSWLDGCKTGKLVSVVTATDVVSLRKMTAPGTFGAPDEERTYWVGLSRCDINRTTGTAGSEPTSEWCWQNGDRADFNHSMIPSHSKFEDFRQTTLPCAMWRVTADFSSSLVPGKCTEEHNKICWKPMLDFYTETVMRGTGGGGLSAEPFVPGGLNGLSFVFNGRAHPIEEDVVESGFLTSITRASIGGLNACEAIPASTASSMLLIGLSTRAEDSEPRVSVTFTLPDRKKGLNFPSMTVSWLSTTAVFPIDLSRSHHYFVVAAGTRLRIWVDTVLVAETLSPSPLTTEETVPLTITTGDCVRGILDLSLHRFDPALSASKIFSGDWSSVANHGLSEADAVAVSSVTVFFSEEPLAECTDEKAVFFNTVNEVPDAVMCKAFCSQAAGFGCYKVLWDAYSTRCYMISDTPIMQTHATDAKAITSPANWLECWVTTRSVRSVRKTWVDVPGNAAGDCDVLGHSVFATPECSLTPNAYLDELGVCRASPDGIRCKQDPNTPPTSGCGDISLVTDDNVDTSWQPSGVCSESSRWWLQFDLSTRSRVLSMNFTSQGRSSQQYDLYACRVDTFTTYGNVQKCAFFSSCNSSGAQIVSCPLNMTTRYVRVYARDPAGGYPILDDVYWTTAPLEDASVVDKFQATDFLTRSLAVAVLMPMLAVFLIGNLSYTSSAKCCRRGVVEREACPRIPQQPSYPVANGTIGYSAHPNMVCGTGLMSGFTSIPEYEGSASIVTRPSGQVTTRLNNGAERTGRKWHGPGAVAKTDSEQVPFADETQQNSLDSRTGEQEVVVGKSSVTQETSGETCNTAMPDAVKTPFPIQLHEHIGQAPHPRPQQSRSTSEFTRLGPT